MAGQLNGSTPELRHMRGLLRSFFTDYLRIFEQDAAAKLCLDRITFSRMTLDGVGLLAEIPTRKEKETVTVLVQIEPEALHAAEAAERIRRSLQNLRIPWATPVLASVLYLRGGRPGASLESEAVARIDVIETARAYFTAISLAATRAEPYLRRPEPLAWALAAWMRPTERTLDEHRRACLERIAAGALDEKRRTLLRRSVRAGMGLLEK
jgi:hypothetical protein